ncbi:MAG: hypothetical protein QG641_887, partial [Candidatus Poribacteria bacterium]|nr:hypothetical protein [Candidatus Poribacteria bacterium]
MDNFGGCAKTPILEPGQTGVIDRGYQDHERFDE